MAKMDGATRVPTDSRGALGEHVARRLGTIVREAG